MIASVLVISDAWLPLICWSLACWILGVGWAAYRALGWVDRMRSWAWTVASPVDLEGRSFSGAPLVGAADHEGNDS